MTTKNFYTTYYSSPIGLLQIKADEEAVNTILFVNADKGNQSDEILWQSNAPKNIIVERCIQQLNEYFEGKRTAFDFPVKQQGTNFQLKVWNTLLDIPYGKTISYLQLSQQIGNAKAVRAVGTTNGKNQLCIVVPCHRVIGANGSLTGYSGELWRKKWLLNHERLHLNVE
jgi:methylated-DNA-[protein]-cysteine S-methyltransferase